MSGRERTVSLSIKARDEYSAQIKAAKKALDSLRDAQKRTENQRATTVETQALRKQIEEVAAAYQSAQREAQELGRAANIKMDGAAASATTEIAREFDRARAEASAYREELQRLNADLSKLRGASLPGGLTGALARQGVMVSQAAQARAAADALRAQMEAQQQAIRDVAAKARAQAEISLGARGAGGVQDFSAPVGTIQANRQKLAELRTEAQRLTLQYNDARDATAMLGRALKQSEAPTETMIRDFDRARANLVKMREEMNRAISAIGAFGRKAEGLHSGVAGIGAPPMATGTAVVLPRGGWWSRFADSFTESAATAHGRGPLGLRPYELQNLGYQINDLFTQIASGTSPMQALAQQGGQIAQIFPQATATIVRMVPQMLALAGAATTLYSAFARLRETADLEKQFSRQIASLSEAPNIYDATSLTNLVRELQRVGVAASDSRAALSSMMRDGVSEEDMRRLILSARDFSAVWGVEFPDALRAVRAAFDGTYESIAALDDEYNFLTAAQRKSIREMYDQGDSVRATGDALDIFAEKMNDAAEKERGDWANAKRELSIAWQELLDWLGTTAPIQAGVTAVAGLAGAVSAVASALNSIDTERLSLLWRFAGVGFDFLTNPAAGIRTVIGAARDLVADEPRSPGPEQGPQLPDTAGPPMPSETQLKAAQESEFKRREAQAKLQAKIDAQNADREFEASIATKSELEQTQERNLREATNAAAADGLDVSEATRESIKDSTAALYQQEKAAEAVADAEKARLKTAEDQAEVLKKIDAQNADREFEASIAGKSELAQRQARNLRDAETEAQQAGIELDEQRRQSILATTAAVYQQEQAHKKASGSRRKAKSEEKQQDEAQRDLEKELNDLVEQRSLLIEQIEFFEDSGRSTQADALRSQMDGVNESIQGAIDNLRAFWDSVGGGGAEGAAALLRLDMLEQQIAVVGDRAATSGKQMNDMLSDGAAGAIDRFSEAVVENGRIWESAREAFLEFASDFLREIAQMIARQALLNALGAGGAGGGGGIGGIISGAINALVRHGGGLASGSGLSRQMPAALFAAAPRYHGGGIAGLRPNEVPAILEREEEVLKRSDPRHVLNGGLGGGQAAAPVVNVRNVNVIDPTEVLAAALSTAAGQQVIYNFMRGNSRRVQSALGG